MLTGLLHYCTLLSKEFLLFSTMPIFIEMVTPIRTTIAIHLMVSLVIHVFEDMRTWLTNIGSCTICFLVFHTIPCFLSVVFSIMSSVVLSTPGDVRATTQCQMSPLPTVFTLRNSWVHICSVNSRMQLNSFSKLSKACKYFTTNYQGSRSEINKMTAETKIPLSYYPR